jgi:hypothetical protein
MELLESDLNSVDSVDIGITRKEKLENEEYDWNLFNTEINEEKLNHFLRFE